MNYGYRYFSDQQDADEMQSANGLFQRRDSSPSNRSEMARQSRINSPSICSDGNQLDFANRSRLRNSPSICTDGSRSNFGNRSEMGRQIHRKSRSSYGNRYEVGRQRHRNSPSSCSDGRRFSYGNRYEEGTPRQRNSPTICSGSSRSDFGNRSEGVRQRRRNSPSLCSGSNRSSFGNRSEVDKELYHRYLSMGFSPEEARNALNNSSNKKRTSEYSNPDRVVAKRRNSYSGEEAFRTIVPGGVNDPLIKGLSKKAIQIYRHFLFEGMLPNEALQKTQEVNGSDLKVISSKCSTSSSSQCIAIKAASNTSIAKKVNIETKNSSNTDMPPPSKAAVSNVTRVAIMACSYPDYLLDREELHQLEESIVDEISAASGNDIKPHFEAVHFKDGMILVDCANIPTAQWLLEISGNITNWNGVPLCACLDSKVPSQNTVSIHFQRGGEKNPKQLLDLLMKQNEGINTALWTILHTRQTDRGGIVLTMIIDHDSLNYIRLKDFNLWYRFGYAHVRLHLQSTINNISQAADGKNDDNTSADENNIQIDDALDGSEDIVDLTEDELIIDIKHEKEQVNVDNDKQELSNEENGTEEVSYEENDTEEVSNEENNTENEHIDGSKDIINLTEDELIIDIKQEKEHADVHENCKNYEQEDNGEENSNVMDDNE